jgi:NADP-reducing hydrogenase subunit HndB
MPKLTNLEDLKRLKAEAQRTIRVREGTTTKIVVGLGTCGIAAGAREVMQAILAELARRDIEATVSTTGCVGMCAQEPLVDVEQAGRRVTYGKMTAEKVPVMIEEHLIRGNVVTEWVVARGSPTA